MTWDPRLSLKWLFATSVECFLCGRTWSREDVLKRGRETRVLECKEGLFFKLHVCLDPCARAHHPEVLRHKYLDAVQQIARRPVDA